MATATSIERRVSGASERRRYYRGGRRLEDLPSDADPQARVNDVASELAKRSNSESQSSHEWTDEITREVEAALHALRRRRQSPSVRTERNNFASARVDLPQRALVISRANSVRAIRT